MSLTKLRAGKVRDLYDAGDGLLLMVASNRVSAFDVVLPQAIPDKGRVLTAMTVHWTLALSDLAPSHLVTADPAELPPLPEELADPRDGPVAGRAMLVRRAEMLPIECIVRGYLAGSAAEEYQEAGTVHGTTLPPGLALADRLPEPLFTPSVKAEEGHDRNISFAEACELVGPTLAEQARDLCLEAYRRAAALAEARGILVADTKFELGLIEGRLAICDEVLTPDSSRFWPADAWAPGRLPPSFDKQPLRDWLARSGWDKRPPAPDLPPEVVEATAQRYRTAYELLCGASLDDWYGAAA
jgi:phosphoribosylaminoimidazole-succinocarboxamide synthase